MDVKNLFINLSGSILNVLVAFVAIKIFMDLLSAKSKIVGSLKSATGGLTSKARDRAHSTGYYQRREMARNQRKGERQRSATEGYAHAITYEGDRGWRRARAKMLQRRAGGRDAAAQNRARVGGIGALEKLESQEDRDAATLLKYKSVQSPGELATVAAGGTVKGVNGSTNPALQRAAMRKIIAAQDAGALESLFLPPNTSGAPVGAPGVDLKMLIREIQDDYSNAKAAGAHLVTMRDPAHGPYTRPEINIEAARALGGLAEVKLAAQDGPAWDSALAGFNAVDPATGNYVLSRDDRFRLWKTVQDIQANPQSRGLVKDSAKHAYTDIFNAPAP